MYNMIFTLSAIWKPNLANFSPYLLILSSDKSSRWQHTFAIYWFKTYFQLILVETITRKAMQTANTTCISSQISNQDTVSFLDIGIYYYIYISMGIKETIRGVNHSQMGGTWSLFLQHRWARYQEKGKAINM